MVVSITIFQDSMVKLLNNAILIKYTNMDKLPMATIGCLNYNNAAYK